jgi:hypothetical protein
VNGRKGLQRIAEKFCNYQYPNSTVKHSYSAVTTHSALLRGVVAKFSSNLHTESLLTQFEMCILPQGKVTGLFAAILKDPHNLLASCSAQFLPVLLTKTSYYADGRQVI